MSQTYKSIGLALLLAFVSASASAQTKTPNPEAAQILRAWPITGIWQTLLGRREDQTLSCIMLSGHKDAGQVSYVAGFRQLPKELALVVGDREQDAISGNHVRLLIDGVEVGDFPITKRVDDKTAMHSISATVPERDSRRVINLFKTGSDVKFLTDKATFDFPLTGATAGIENMRQCLTEVANLAPTGK
jgi:hypothetical protein